MIALFWVFTIVMFLHAIFVDTHRSICYIISWIIMVVLLKSGALFYITGC